MGNDKVYEKRRCREILKRNVAGKNVFHMVCKISDFYALSFHHLICSTDNGDSKYD